MFCSQENEHNKDCFCEGMHKYCVWYWLIMSCPSLVVWCLHDYPPVLFEETQMRRPQRIYLLLRLRWKDFHQCHLRLLLSIFLMTLLTRMTWLCSLFSTTTGCFLGYQSLVRVSQVKSRYTCFSVSFFSQNPIALLSRVRMRVRINCLAFRHLKDCDKIQQELRRSTFAFKESNLENQEFRWKAGNLNSNKINY